MQCHTHICQPPIRLFLAPPFPLSLVSLHSHIHSSFPFISHSISTLQIGERGNHSSSPQTKRGLCPCPHFPFLFSIISTPQSPHFPPLSLLSFFPSFLPSLSSPRWHHHPHRVTIPANNQSRLDARTPSAPIVALSTKPTTPLDATNAPSPSHVPPTDSPVSHPIDA